MAGKTLGADNKFVKKLKKKGAKVVADKEKSDYTILFCPIVSRFECDITAALADAEAKALKKLILVAMHHTLNECYVLPQHRNIDNPNVELLVECLFHEKKGLLKCPQNKDAKKKICEKLGLKRLMFRK